MQRERGGRAEGDREIERVRPCMPRPVLQRTRTPSLERTPVSAREPGRGFGVWGLSSSVLGLEFRV